MAIKPRGNTADKIREYLDKREDEKIRDLLDKAQKPVDSKTGN